MLNVKISTPRLDFRSQRVHEDSTVAITDLGKELLKNGTVQITL